MTNYFPKQSQLVLIRLKKNLNTSEVFTRFLLYPITIRLYHMCFINIYKYVFNQPTIHKYIV